MASNIIPLSELDPNSDVIPEVDADRGFRVFGAWERYTGPKGTGKYVPNVDDEIRDWVNGTWRVIEVDYTTGLSKLQLWTPPSSGTTPDYNEIVGYGPGLLQSESCRLYVNKRTTPAKVGVDRQLYFYSGISHVKIFKGYDISEATGVICAWYYTGNGNDADEKIPVALVKTPSGDNRGIVAPLDAFTTMDLKEGDVTTVVAYNGAGDPVSRAVLFVMETAFVRPSEQNASVITGIELISPFLSDTEQDVIEVAKNTTIESLAMLCRIHYNDGYRDVAIDGAKIRLDGWDHYVATIDGERCPVVLQYILDSDEASIAGGETNKRFVNRQYWARTKPVIGAYSLKLFPILSWINEQSGWNLEWYLYNADRRRAYYATPYVELNANSAPFYPLRYGAFQEMGFSIDITKVDPTLKEHRHTQEIGITLLGSGLYPSAPWLIQYDKGATVMYGRHVEARFSFVAVGNWTLNLGSGLSTEDLWLEEAFYATYPLFIAGEELKAPRPTHFALIMDNIREEHPISDWNKDLTVATGMNAGQGLVIQWIHRLPNTDLQLGASPFVVRHMNVTKTN